MENVELTEMQSIWLAQLLSDAAAEALGGASNNHLFALGSEGEEAAQFEEYAEELRDYAVILHGLIDEFGLREFLR